MTFEEKRGGFNLLYLSLVITTFVCYYSTVLLSFPKNVLLSFLQTCSYPKPKANKFKLKK